MLPAIAISMQDKTRGSFECPTRQIATLGQLLKSVTKVLMIGWRAREAHFLQMLRDNLPGGVVSHLVLSKRTLTTPAQRALSSRAISGISRAIPTLPKAASASLSSRAGNLFLRA